MPVLSLFYGLIVRMYKETSGKHHKPHIHKVNNILKLNH
jgi:hypothetical protein